MPASLLGDPAVMSWPRTGLAHTRDQPKIADQLLGCFKALDIANCCHQRNRHHVDAWDSHQACDALVSQTGAREIPLDHPEIFRQPIEFPQMPLNGIALIVRQDLFGWPGSSYRAAQVSRGT
jgi:hypothetical protein